MNREDQNLVRHVNQKHREISSKVDLIHNQELHQQILEDWKQESPEMYQSLSKLGILEKMAFVQQQEMWSQYEQNLRAGMQVTDAREQAERETLLMEPVQSELERISQQI